MAAVEASEALAPGAVRNLVICCDGTGNIWGNRQDTNVVRLVRACVKSPQQIIYYDPGVGTASQYPSVGWVQWIRIWAGRIVGLVFAGGIYDDIGSAYAFLIHHYRPGDRIWVFGFSRGAFTARAVAGMVNLFGVVRPAGRVMIPTLLRIYFSNDSRTNENDHTRDDLANDIRENFTDPVGHEARIWFTGVWDTVASVGGLRTLRITSALSAANKRFDHIRHAVSVVEDRASYRPRCFRDDEVRDEPGRAADGTYHPGLKQLYFAGVHSDVGGSYPERGLSDCALRWMLDEAQAKGLAIAGKAANEDRPDPMDTAHDQVTGSATSCLWALAGLRRRVPEPEALRHPSLVQRLRQGGGIGKPSTPLHRQPPFWFALAAVGVLAAWGTAFQAGGVNILGLISMEWRGLVHPDPTGQAMSLGATAAADFVFSLACLYFGCHLCVASVRTLRGWRPNDDHAHAALRWWGQLPLLIAPPFAWLAGLSTWHATSDPAWGWTFAAGMCCAIRVTALLCTLALALFALGRSVSLAVK